MSEWRDIASAPRDGTAVLVYCPVPVALDEQAWCWPEDAALRIFPARWHEPDDRTDEEAGWYAPWFYLSFGPYDDRSTDIDAASVSPTHWQFLPDPPDAR